MRQTSTRAAHQLKEAVRQSHNRDHEHQIQGQASTEKVLPKTHEAIAENHDDNLCAEPDR
jgi:hypothetical protein